MLARLSLISRLALLLALGAAITASPILGGLAFAQDEWGEDPFAEEADEEDDEQPPVTAGGLFTKKTWPLAELDRPLTLVKGMLEVRGGVDIDMSADTAFETWALVVDGRYGLQDNLELQGGLAAEFITEEGDDNAMALYAGLEAAIVYDLVDFRALALVPLAPESTLDIAIGLPFRYKPKPNVGIIALDKIITIHTESALVDGEESSKPDLTIGVGIIYQVTNQFAALLRGELIIPRFNTEKGNRSLPATAAFQYTPNNKIDFGGEFTFGNVEADEPFDERSLLLYVQVRL